MCSGVYTTNSADAVQYVLKDCDADLVIVENNEQLKKVLAIWDSLPALQAIIQYAGELGKNRPKGVFEVSALTHKCLASTTVFPLKQFLRDCIIRFLF